MKKALSILLSLVVVLATLPLTAVDAFAETDGDYTYTVTNGEATVTGYLGADTAVTVPSTLGGCPVTSIGNNAFQNNTTLTAVSFPDTLVSIGNYAFATCTALQSVVIPNSVTTLGTSVFDSCTALASVSFGTGLSAIGEYDFFRCTSLTTVTIPGNIQTIGRNAFDYCSGITQLNLNPGLISIGRAAFGSNTGLTRVTLPNTVTTLCEAAFGTCTNLERIDIPASVTCIERYAFERDNKINAYITDLAAWCSINFNNGAGQYYSTPTEIGGDLYLNGTLLENLVIPAGVTDIAQGAFDGCGAIKNVVIPEGVTTIKDYTFRGCTGLESITVPSTVTRIAGNYTFQNCKALNAVHIPDVAAWCNITFDNENVNPLYFAHNLYLTNSLIPTTTITIPNTVTAIKPYAFAGLSNDVVIPSTVTSIGNYAFYYSSMTNATLSEGLLSIGNYAFTNNPNLAAVDLPDSLTSIGTFVFNNCTALRDVEIGTGLTAIGNYDFYQCAIEELTIPANIVTIGNDAFDMCKRLETLNLNQGLVTIGNAAFGTNTSLKRVTIPDTVTTIGSYAFGTCTSLEWVDIPASVTAIGSYAFEKNNEFVTNITDLSAWCRIQFNGTSGQFYSNPTERGHKLYLNGELITDLVIPDGVTSIPAGAFDRCTYIESVTIPDSVTTIGKYAFRGSNNIETVTIGSGVTAIGDNAFTECTGLREVHIDDVAAWCGINFADLNANPLTFAHDLYVNDVYATVTVPNTVTDIKQYVFTGISNPVIVAGGVENIRYRAFYDATTQSVTLNEGLKTIENDAFSRCNNLLSIDLPDSLTTIGTYVFNECTSLKDVEIGTGLTAIGNYDFYKCTSIEEITIPANIVTIGNDAFDMCTGLETLNLNEGLVTIGNAAFGTNTSLTRVTIPDTVTTIGSYAFGTCTSLQWIDIPASVTSIGGYAFEKNNEFVTNITDVAAWCAIRFNGTTGQYYSCPFEKGHILYLNGEPLTDLVIPEGVTSIAQGAFDGCTTIQTVRLPSTLTEVKNYTFRNATNLTSIAVPDSVTAMNSGAFSGCGALTNVVCGKDSYAASFLPAKTVYLGDMDGDKDFTAADFGALVNASLDETTLTDNLLKLVADYNMDGVVDALDCRLVKLLSQGKELPA